MSFFADRPQPAPDEPEPERIQPAWFGPPGGVLPGFDPQRAVLFHTSEAILVIGKFDAYPTGATFSVTLQLRTDDHHFEHLPFDRGYRKRSGDDLPDDLIRLGVVYADGTSWSNVDGRHLSSSEAPDPPVVLARGGGGGGDRWSMEHWMWPLPPAGPLTFVAEWPSYGISEARAVVDATALRAAAGDAVQLWP